MSCETFKCRCRCRCYEKCEPKRECECRHECEPRRECECRRECEPKRECECKPRHECKPECEYEPRREYECECEHEHEQDQGKNCEWFEKVLREFYWSGFHDGCKKCGRKENECGYEGYEEYKKQFLKSAGFDIQDCLKKIQSFSCDGIMKYFKGY